MLPRESRLAGVHGESRTKAAQRFVHRAPALYLRRLMRHTRKGRVRARQDSARAGVQAATQNGVSKMDRNRARWFFILMPVLVFWIVASIDKLGVSVIVTNRGFLQDMGLLGNPAAIGLLGT